jgi:DNA-binding NarL/FixJ family response regulator
MPLQPLRVAIVARDDERHAQLARLVADLGHEIVSSADAQVVLCDGVSAPDRIPSVALGPSEDDHAGQLPHDAGAAQIDAALRAVAVGLTVRHRYEPAGFAELADRLAADLLTPRELEVLAAISDGMSNKSVARKLGISLHTVKFHVESLLRKLGAHTRAEAVARGLERRKAETVDI